MNLVIDGLARSLSSLATLVGSYDLALIALGAGAYLILAPFSYHGQRTIYRIQQLRPLLENLKARFKDDRARLNRALLALYRERYIALAGAFLGVVPAFAQVLFVIAVYLAVSVLPLNPRGSIIPWLRDLSAADPFFVLPIFMGAVLVLRWYVARKFNPSNESRAKERLMLGLAIAVTAVSAVLPAGVTLFWSTYTALMAGQHYLVMQHLLKHGVG